jgi:parafibromin
VPDAADVEVVKKIRQGEIELRDHNTVLRGIKNNVRAFISSFLWMWLMRVLG